MIVIKCDRCKKVSEPVEDEWRAEGFTSIFLAIGSGIKHVKRHLCMECRLALKIADKDTDKSIEQRLLEILEEIAQGSVENTQA